MALGKLQAERKWLSIHHGKVELSENGKKQLFAYVEGRLQRIYTKVRNYGGEKVTKWFIDIEDGKRELYTISFPYNSGTLRSIVLALASDETLNNSSVVRIEPYQKANFTNVVVWADGVKLDWVISELPPVSEVTINGKTYKDETTRNELIASLVEQINKRISTN